MGHLLWLIDRADWRKLSGRIILNLPIQLGDGLKTIRLGIVFQSAHLDETAENSKI
jgi:hypothetical protein